jgi:16S rRNA C967 or C1407 C5-methylase (RsmB/RsmF family)
MGRQKTRRAPSDEFDETYAEIFQERWLPLKEALTGTGDLRIWQYPACKPYALDSASILAALALPLDNALTLFDCCAAPGGKTVVLASVMHQGTVLRANDRSAARTARLKKTIFDCLPQEKQMCITVTQNDAARLAKKSSTGTDRYGKAEHTQSNDRTGFDAIFLDAPCSSERHVLNSPEHLDLWTRARSKNLATMQWALLSAAYRLLNEGGMLVYATCALHPRENDGVVSRLPEKFPDARIVSRAEPPACAGDFFSGSLPVPEKTLTGYRILPDAAGGAGPMFFACVHKPASDGTSEAGAD